MARVGLFAAATMLALSPASLSAQDGTTASEAGQARARVVTNLQVAALAELQFGAIIVGVSETGAVTIGHGAGQATYLGSARSGCAEGGACAPHPARFRVSGEASRNYRITIGAGVLARGQAWGETLEVRELTVMSANLASTQGDGRLDAAGIDYFTIGGTLEVPAGTAPDIFRADLPVTVAYE